MRVIFSWVSYEGLLWNWIIIAYIWTSHKPQSKSKYFIIFREEATSALAGFHVGPLSECWFLWREKTGEPRRAHSPLRHPCSPNELRNNIIPLKYGNDHPVREGLDSSGLFSQISKCSCSYKLTHETWTFVIDGKAATISSPSVRC